jgi:hypothetical protein
MRPVVLEAVHSLMRSTGAAAAHSMWAVEVEALQRA